MKYSTTLKIKDMNRVLMMIVCDVLIILASLCLARALRENSIEDVGIKMLLNSKREVVVMILAVCSVLGFGHCYTVSWRYAGFKEYITLFIGTLIGFIGGYIFSKIFVYYVDMHSISDYIIAAILAMIGFALERYCGGIYRNIVASYKNNIHNREKKRVLIVGAGDTGTSLVKTMKKASEMYPVCFIDDDENKLGMRIANVTVVGTRKEIPRVVKEYKIQEIVIAIPTVEGKSKQEILKICRSTGVKTLTVPSLFELASGKANISQVREITPQELLGRSEQLVEDSEIFAYIDSKTILVTGGGGSIGSELCRQIVKYNPKKLIVFDIYENNAYELQMELRRKFPELRMEVLIGSVRDKERLSEIFEKYHPKVVFHAAAHKHVPLMEDSPDEAIKNNIYGTYNVCEACEKYNAERFVLISTDKAVNPTNIMGASKRIAEMVVQQFAFRNKSEEKRTIYAAVRFGNVLGSNGSVIPLFKKQIKEGGPVTVTHPDINRFFMTIPEAVSLVMQAGSYATGGEIFILDMGEPVKIVDLAKNLIELSGFVPDVDIKIEFTGLRHGEKLYEELLLDRQKHDATKHDKIFIEKPITDGSVIISEIASLKERISCDVTKYEEMTDWFINAFNIK